MTESRIGVNWVRTHRKRSTLNTKDQKSQLTAMKKNIMQSMHGTFETGIWKDCGLSNPMDRGEVLKKRTKRLETVYKGILGRG